MSAGYAVRRLERSGDLLGLIALDSQRYPALLESAATGTGLARYDIVPALPGERLVLDDRGELHGPHRGEGGGFLDALDAWWRDERDDARVPALPFRGGWLVFLGYELAAAIEPRVPVPATGSGFPRALALRCHGAVVRDHFQHCTWAVAREAADVERIVRDLDAAEAAPVHAGPILSGGIDEDPPDRFLAGVERILRYIRDGDVFQANLSRAWRAELARGVRPEALYARLRSANPAPFAAIANLGGRWILSSSPERLFSTRDGRVDTRPIAGTHRRDADDARDRELKRALIAHPKERAEHIMLIDLERNDLGRVCVAGSVEVDELMALESYTHVHHIVSNVHGRLREDVTPGQVIRAVFPGGTITGCPKVRCMEIIAELEQVRRGPYTGSLGYLNADGSGDFNILIRTLALEDGTVELRAGAGIVADSLPERELEETRHKARGPLRALVPQHP